MPLIEIRGLTKYYQMGDSVVRALDGVDLSIERGEFLAITGASGSGKSTMMHLLGCLDRPTAGSYHLDGRDVSVLSDRELADIRNRKIGFVFQTFNLINRTSAAENVGVPLFYARKLDVRTPAVRALERVGLSQRAAHLPSELSGGERQRVAIARAIVNDPVLLLADEPTGNLDSRTGEQIMEIFHGLNAQGVTIVIVTHEPDIAAQARRVVQMRDGKIVFDGPASQVYPARTVATGAEVAPVRDGVPQSADASASPVLPAAEVDSSRLHARWLPGAKAAWWCGLSAIVLQVAGLLAVILVAALTGYKPPEPSVGQPAALKMPPVPVMIASIAGGCGYIVALGLAVTAIVMHLRARAGRRQAIANWKGARRALAGGLMGWATVLYFSGSIAYILWKLVAQAQA